MNELPENWCYRFKGETEFHYGPFKAKDQPELLEKLRSFHGSSKIQGVEYWTCTKDTYLHLPKTGSGTPIYGYDDEHGRRKLRNA